MSADPTATHDLAAYGRAMARFDGHSDCYRIEQKYGLDGYPPELVCVGLRAAAEGRDAHEAVEAYIAGKEVQP